MSDDVPFTIDLKACWQPTSEFEISEGVVETFLHPKPVTGYGQTRLTIHDPELVDQLAALRAGAAAHHVSETRPDHCGYCGDRLVHVIQVGGGEWCLCQRCPVVWWRLADSTWAEEVY